MRSYMAAQILEARGYTRLFNLSGGIDRWSLEVDRTVPRY
jgi:rhodanese-related sulfurtransferase